jgi:hypothetical protein
MTLNEFQKKPTLNVDGVKWVQNCYLCNGQINFIKDSKVSWLAIGDGLVRHSKCLPPPIR